MPKKASRRADGRMELKRTMPDGTQKHFYGQTKKQCEAAYAQALVQWEAAQAQAAAGPLFTEVLDAWWAAKEPQLRSGTIKCYRPAIRRAREAFGQKRVTEITAEDISNLLLGMKQQGFATKTISNQHCVLDMVFEYIAINCNTKTNPSTLVSTPRAGKTVRKPPAADQTEAIRTALQTAAQSGEISSGCMLAALYLYTGCRRGEGLALQWRDVDLTKKRISITKSVEHRGNQPVIAPPKTDNGNRVVPILPPLERLLRAAGRHRSTDYLTGGPDPLTYSEFQARWGSFCHEAGCAHLAPKSGRMRWQGDITPHQLRHGFATEMYRAGVPMEVAVRLMGHADSQMIKRVYLDVNASMLDDAAALLMSRMT